MAYTQRFDLFPGTSADSSNVTSASYLVADYTLLSVSWDTDTTTASTLTLQSSNEDGLTASITTWSNLSGITQQGTYIVNTGFRWMRALRNSNESLSRARVQAKQER